MARTTMKLMQLKKEEMHEDWISISSFSKRTGWTKDTVYQWIREGKIEGRLFHNIILVRNIETQTELSLGVIKND